MKTYRLRGSVSVQKHGILESLEENIDVMGRKKKKEWMTNARLSKMDGRQSENQKPYRQLDKEIKQDCEIAKDYYKANCEEIECLEKENKSSSAHQKIKEITDRKHSMKKN